MNQVVLDMSVVDMYTYFCHLYTYEGNCLVIKYM